MTIAMELAPDLAVQVIVQAEEEGLSLPEFLHSLIARALKPPAPHHLGWPEGFFEETYGSLADSPLTRLPQGEADTREPSLRAA